MDNDAILNLLNFMTSPNAFPWPLFTRTSSLFPTSLSKNYHIWLANAAFIGKNCIDYAVLGSCI
jgi:hypothetical protein